MKRKQNTPDVNDSDLSQREKHLGFMSGQTLCWRDKRPVASRRLSISIVARVLRYSRLLTYDPRSLLSMCFSVKRDTILSRYRS